MLDAQKKPYPRASKRLIVSNAIAWAVLLSYCIPPLMLVAALGEPGRPASWLKFWGAAALVGIFPFAVAFSWLIFRGVQRVAREGVNSSGRPEAYIARIWPVLLPLLPVLASASIAYATLFFRRG